MMASKLNKMNLSSPKKRIIESNSKWKISLITPYIIFATIFPISQ